MSSRPPPWRASGQCRCRPRRMQPCWHELTDVQYGQWKGSRDRCRCFEHWPNVMSVSTATSASRAGSGLGSSRTETSFRHASGYSRAVTLSSCISQTLQRHLVLVCHSFDLSFVLSFINRDASVLHTTAAPRRQRTRGPSNPSWRPIVPDIAPDLPCASSPFDFCAPHFIIATTLQFFVLVVSSPRAG